MALHERDVEIRRPCPVKLDPGRAEGGAKSWYCGHCRKSVHVLSNMTEVEARDFLGARVGQDLCVTYALRRDGSIRFEPKPPAAEPSVVPLASLTRRRRLAAVGLGAALAACAPHDNPKVEARIEGVETPVVAGRVSPTIPDAPPEPDEVLVDGEIEPLPMKPGGMKVKPLPSPAPAGGITVEALPPEVEDEPCDGSAAADHEPMRRGGTRGRS